MRHDIGQLKFIAGLILGISTGLLSSYLWGRGDAAPITSHMPVANSTSVRTVAAPSVSDAGGVSSGKPFTMPAPRAGAAVAVGAVNTGSLEAVLNSVESQRRQQMQAQLELLERVKRDPGLKAALFEKYKTVDPADADELRFLLQQVGGPDLQQFAKQLGGSADPKVRAKAYALMQGADQEGPGSTSSFLRERLWQEADPVALGWLVNSMDSKAGITPQERQGVAERLQQLSRHQDPDLRAQSLGALARWTGSAEVQATLVSALQDPSSTVQTSAIYALMDARVNSAPVRQSLFQMARNSAQNPETRQAAVSALEQMDLNVEEFAWLIQVRDALRQ